MPRKNRSPDRSAAAGFTLIEVVIVMVIIAILALAALPALYGNTTRMQIKDSESLSKVAMDGVRNYYSNSGEMPASNDQAGIPESNKLISKFVSDTRIVDGVVIVTFGNNAHAKLMGKKLTYRPAYVSGTKVSGISWLCAAQPVPNGMTAAGSNGTTISNDMLPASCL